MPNHPVGCRMTPRAFLDLARPTGPLARDREAIATAWSLNSTPSLNFDGNPARFSYAEYRAAVDNPYVVPHAKRVLHRMHPYFYADDVGPGGPRQVHTISTGTRVETYRGTSPQIMQRLEQMTRALAQEPKFRDLLARTTIVVAPPGRGLDAIEALGPAYAEAEGCAIHAGLPGIPGPALAVRGESLMSWDLGFTHEMIHLLESDLGPAASQQVDAVWERLSKGRVHRDDYANPREMLAFLGQWHLAGYGHIVEERAPEVAALCREVLGTNARVSAGQQSSEGMARQAIESLVRWFETGVSPRN